eukprot:SAG31_NODE_831_length_11669_cov_3.410026_1_plen_82_part_00
MLESPEFEAELRGCCTALRAMSGAERLAWFDQETLFTEMVHNFSPSSGEVSASSPMHSRSFCGPLSALLAAQTENLQRAAR